MATNEVLKSLDRFIEQVRGLGIPVEAAYLFGSYAQGRSTEWSDIDLALVSSAFQGTKFYDRRKLDRAVIAVDTAIEPHPYRPEDFKESNPSAREIMRTGIRIV